jgi:hypothetical protein
MNTELMQETVVKGSENKVTKIETESYLRGRSLTTHSTGALDSMAFMLVFSDGVECFMLAPG